MATAVTTASYTSTRKNIVGKLGNLFRASDVERFFLVFQQKKSVVVPNLHSTLYLSSGILCIVFFSKIFKSSWIFANIKWNVFAFFQPFSEIDVKVALRMTVGKISVFFRKKLVFRNLYQICVKTSDFRLTRYTTILKQLSTSTEEPLRKSSPSMWPFLIHSFFSHFELFFLTFVKMFSELLSKLHLTLSEKITE